MKKILITGSGGVLGSSFKDEKFKKKHIFKLIFSNSKICDLRDFKKSLKYIKKISPDFIINLAAVSGGINLSKNNHASMLRDNILINLNILEISRLLKIKKIIMTLTNGMYSEKAKQPYKEIDIHYGYPPKNNYGSSFAKRLIDPAIKAYREQYKLNCIGLIVPNLYGPNDNFNLKHSTMISATIHKVFIAKRDNQPLIVWGNGKAIRDYMLAENVRDIFMWALKNYSSSTSLNIGSGKKYSIRKLVFKVCKIFNFDKKNIIFDSTKPNGVFTRVVDIANFKKIYKNKLTSIDDGLKKTISWFVKNFKNINKKEKL
jgi:GDP-L-fucose synthase